MRGVKKSNGNPGLSDAPGNHAHPAIFADVIRAGQVRGPSAAPLDTANASLRPGRGGPSAPQLRTAHRPETSPDTVRAILEPSAPKMTRPFGWISCEPDSIRTASS